MSRKGQKDKKKEDKTPVDPNYVGELDKQFYENEIASIKAKIDRQRSYQIELQDETIHFQNKMKEVEVEKSIIIEELKVELQNREAVRDQKKEQVLFMILELDRKKEFFEERIKQLEVEYEEMVQRLTKELAELNEWFETVKHFKDNKEAMLDELSKCYSKYEEREKQHKRNLFLMEEKFAEGRGRLKRELENRMFHMSFEIQQTTSDVMPPSLLRLIHENMALENELMQMEETLEELRRSVVTLKKQKKKFNKMIPVREEEKITIFVKSKIQSQIINSIAEKVGKIDGQVENLCEIEEDTIRLTEAVDETNFLLDKAKSEHEELLKRILEKENLVASMKASMLFLKRIIRRLVLILNNSRKAVNEMIAIKLIPIGELEEEVNLPLDEQKLRYSIRREKAFHRKGRHLNSIINLLSRAQLNEDEMRACHHDTLDVEGLNFSRIIPQEDDSTEAEEKETDEFGRDSGSISSKLSIRALSNESLPRIPSEELLALGEARSSSSDLSRFSRFSSIFPVSKAMLESMILSSKSAIKRKELEQSKSRSMNSDAIVVDIDDDDNDADDVKEENQIELEDKAEDNTEKKYEAPEDEENEHES